MLENQVVIFVEILRVDSDVDIPEEYDYDFVVDADTGQDIMAHGDIENAICLRVTHFAMQDHTTNQLDIELFEQGFEGYYCLLFDYRLVDGSYDFYLSEQFFTDIRECETNQLIYTASINSLISDQEETRAKVVLIKNTIC